MNNTQLAQKLAGVIQQVQNIISLGKRIIEFPTQETLEPASYIHVSRNGISEKLEIQKIIDAIANLDYDRLISVGLLSIDDNELKIPAFAQWLIDNIIFGNNAEVSIPIPFAEEGLNRTDLIYGNNLGQILRISGPELEGIFLKPNLPLNCVEITTLNVTDSSIGDPSTPIVGTGYITKNEMNQIGYYLSPEITDVYANAETPSFRFYGSGNTELKSINFFNPEKLYNGQEITFANFGANGFWLRELQGIYPVKMTLPKHQDFFLEKDTIIKFSLNLADIENPKLEFIGPGNHVTEAELNGLQLTSDQPNSLIYLRDLNDNIIATLDVGFLNNEGTTFVYNEDDNTLDLTNDEGQVLSAIPVGSFVSNFAKAIGFNGSTPYSLELKDSTGTVISSVNIGQSNVNGLVSDLAAKQQKTVGATGTVIDFSTSKIFNSPTSPASGNITDSLTGAEIGIVQKIYHNHTVAPTFPAGWVILGPGAYITGEVNIIYAEWVSGSRVEYWIIQEQ